MYLNSFYIAKDQRTYDVFLTKNKESVDNWKVKEIKGKIYKGQSYGGQSTSDIYFVVNKDGSEKYFSNENWNFKNLVDGQDVAIKAKTREYTPGMNQGNTVSNYQPPNENCNPYGPCTPKPGYPQPFSTNLGIFNIESVEKI